MAITIYTYSNPYKINKEPYWDLIKNSFHLCVSQTLASGLCDQYDNFFLGKLATVRGFINTLYNDWESDSIKISQRAAIDNCIEYMDFTDIVKDIIPENIILSLKRNRSEIVKSIRTMFELMMEPENIKTEELSYEQKCIVEIYKELKLKKNKFFELKQNIKEDEIDFAIDKHVSDIIKKNNLSRKSEIRKDSIVIHGIHQFTPIMLKLIEELGKYKLVIILFNYQPDYKNVYQTWLEVYSSFESKIVFSSKNLNNSSQKFEGGRIADNIATLIEGNTKGIDCSDNLEITEFDNTTEFAGYIAKQFENAKKLRNESEQKHSTLYYMEEQIYAADSGVNNILKIYFPEQFGERAFLDYPIGHFFLSIVNMWDPEENVKIRDINDLFECFSCGIIIEEKSGEINTILNKVRLYIENESSIKKIIKRLEQLKSKIDEVNDDLELKSEFKSIEYFNITKEEIDKLILALKELNKILDCFYEEFNNQNNDFKSFYKKISEVLITRVLDVDEISADFKIVVERVLKRLKEVENVEANASFDCLKETMQLYLQQVPKEGMGANWIVRNFEQIDGDVLRKNKEIKKIFHFACLSDRDMSITHKDEFSWPLDINFFEVAQSPVDWKYQVFVTSRKEYKNFRRYALVYGLAFSNSKVKLSYIKNKGDEELDLYYIFKILNAKVVAYNADIKGINRKKTDFIHLDEKEIGNFSQYDLMRYRNCKYRFLLESLIENNSIFKDSFLLKKYLMIILEHRARRYFSGKVFLGNFVFDYLREQMDELEGKCSFINHADSIDVVKSAYKYIEKNALINGKFMNIRDKEKDYMIKREIFLVNKFSDEQDSEKKEIFKNSTQQEVDSILNEEKMKGVVYKKNLNYLCNDCSEKDICLEIFKVKKE